MKFATKVVHGGIMPDTATGAVNTPIYQTSNFVHESPGVYKGYSYSRARNPTRDVLENAMAAIENGVHALAFASGIAAIDAVLRMFKPGDEIITTFDLYGGSLRLFREVFEPVGIKFKYVDFSREEMFRTAVSENTRLIWIETPTNPMMNIINISSVVKIASQHKVLVAVDNTFATPCLQQPLDAGADIVMHSATKYLGGHSDLIMGVVVMNDDSLYEKLKSIQSTCGAVPGPNDCFLTLRGIKTLQIRMERSCKNATKIADFLAEHSAVDSVNYPGLSSHADHELATKQMNDFGAMISFDLRDDSREAAFGVLKKFEVFTLAESLGGVESLCGHPATMSHGSMPREQRLKLGIKDSMIRLSIGIEDVDDLLLDLKQALG